MFTLNQIQIIGNVGRAEVRTTTSGKEVLELGVATSFYRKDKEPETTWHNVTIWEPSDFIKSAMGKGSKVFIQGGQFYSKWTDKDGNEHTRPYINCEKFVLLKYEKNGEKFEKTENPKNPGNEEPVEDLPF